MERTKQQARTFCIDYFGTSNVAFETIPFVDALAGFMLRAKIELLNEVTHKPLEVQQPLELYTQQGILF